MSGRHAGSLVEWLVAADAQQPGEAAGTVFAFNNFPHMDCFVSELNGDHVGN
jgi:hypothetical protein